MNHESDRPREPGPDTPSGHQQAGDPGAELPQAPGDVGGIEPSEAWKAEVTELKDRLLRAHADMDNMRKRAEREKADAHKYAISNFARDIVTVGDNFQRAIAAVPAGAVEQTPALKSFLDGVTLTERELTNVLERHGIKRIDALGELFNPHLHQAISELEQPYLPAGTVVQVVQSGYIIEDRVLRPAMVIVARGGAKPQKAEASGEARVSPRAANDDQSGTGAQGGGSP